MALGKEEVKGIALPIAEVHERASNITEVGVEIDSAIKGGVKASQIDDHTTIDEHPDVIIALESEFLVGLLLVGEGGMEFHGEAEIMITIRSVTAISVQVTEGNVFRCTEYSRVGGRGDSIVEWEETAAAEAVEVG